LVSNGPYVLAEWQPGKRIVLTKNPDYWNASQVSIERIEFPVLPDLAAQFALYEKGDAQVAEFPPEETPRILAEPYLGQELQVLVRPGVSYLGLNTQVSPTLDVNFRRAVASAIDRQALIEEVLKQPWHKPARGVVPPGILGYQGDDPAVGYPYDPEKARSYLAEAGYGQDKRPPVVEIWYNREGNNRVVFEAISGMLEEAGIPTRLVSSKWEDYLAALDSCNKPNRTAATKTPAECGYNLYRMGWVMEYADPAGILSAVFSPKSAFQYTGWQSKPYEELLVKALAEPDEAKRSDLYKQAEKILLNEAVAVIPLQYYDRTILIKAGVTFDYPPLGAPNLQLWRLP
jgi:oligopeptide transport system substrate-binding protein